MKKIAILAIASLLIQGCDAKKTNEETLAALDCPISLGVSFANSTISNIENFTPADPQSYTYSTSTTLFDENQIPHIAQFYFLATGSTSSVVLFVYLEGERIHFPLPTNSSNEQEDYIELKFNEQGLMLGTVPSTPVSSPFRLNNSSGYYTLSINFIEEISNNISPNFEVVFFDTSICS